MQIYIQWSKDDGSTSSSQTLIIPRLPRFYKMSLSKFQLYIEAQTMTQCFVFLNCQNTILIRSDEGKERFFCILHMLRINTGLWKWSKRNVYDLHLLKNKWLLFEEYRTSLNRDKYEIEVRNDDAIKRNQILFGFMQQTFNRMDGLYQHGRFPLIYGIMKDRFRKQSAAEI